MICDRHDTWDIIYNKLLQRHDTWLTLHEYDMWSISLIHDMIEWILEIPDTR